VVKTELDKLGFPYSDIRSGEVEIKRELSPDEKTKLDEALTRMGLGLLDTKKSVLVEKVINVIIDLVHYSDDTIKVNLSDHLREKLGYDYDYLARLFSEVKGITIEHFFINQRIERAKELLIHEEFNLDEIAEKLHFSSTSHFCNQFKKYTGLTPSYFKHVKNDRLSD